MASESPKHGRKSHQIRKKPNELCAKELIKISPYVTAEDRKLAMMGFNISYVTVSRYLNGTVANLVLGIRLLDFFRNQINKRAADLAILCKS